MARYQAPDDARRFTLRSRLPVLLLVVIAMVASLLTVGPRESAQAQIMPGTTEMPAAIGIAANQSDRFSFGTRASSQVMSAQALALFQPPCGGETVVLGGDDLVRTGSVSARSEHGGDFLVSFTGLTDPGYRWQVSYCYTETTTTTVVPETCTIGEPVRDYTQLGHPIISPGVKTCTPGYTTSETEQDVAYLGSEQVIHPDAEKWIEEATENALDARDDLDLDKVYWNSSPGYNSRQIIGLPTFFAASPTPLDTEQTSYDWEPFPLELTGTGGPGDDPEIDVILEVHPPRSEWHFAGELGSIECPTAGRLWEESDRASLVTNDYGTDVCIVAWAETAVAEDSTINPDNDDDFVKLESVQLIYPYDFTTSNSQRVISALTADGTLEFGTYYEETLPNGDKVNLRFGEPDQEFGTEYNGGERKLIVGEVQSYGVVRDDTLQVDQGSAESPWVKWEEDTCQKVGGWFIIGFLAGPVCKFISGVIGAHLAALNIVWDGIQLVGTVVKVIASGLWSLVKGCLSMVGDLFSDIKETGEQFLALASDPAGELAEISDTVQQIAGQLANEETRGDFIEKVLVDFGVELLSLDMILEPDGDGWKLQEDLTANDWIEFGGRVACEVIAAFFGKKIADALKGTRFAQRIQEWLDGRDWPDIPRINIPDNLECVVRVAGYARDLYEVSAGGVPPTETNSFPAGTLVLMADGTYEPIELIYVGDRVLSFDHASSEWEPQLVTAQWSADDEGQLATATLADGSTITATDGHLFWVDSSDAWVELEDVASGDQLLTPDGTVAVAAVVQAPASTSVVWELSVAENQNFAVSSGTQAVLVHNACFPRGGNGNEGGSPAFNQDADGNVTYTYESDGVEIDVENVRLDADGNPVIIRTDDFELVLNTDGTVTVIDSGPPPVVRDGGIVNEDGSITLENPDGSTLVLDGDGDQITLPPDSVFECNSFPAGTQVRMSNGGYQNIEHIEPGDHVLSYDFAIGDWVDGEVTAQWSATHDGPMATATLNDGSQVTATDDHLFWVESSAEWTEIDSLNDGDQLLTPDGSVQVGSVALSESGSFDVWELTVADTHNFTVLAGDHDVLVHNQNGCSVEIGQDADGNNTITVVNDQGEVRNTTTFADGSRVTVENLSNDRTRTVIQDAETGGTIEVFERPNAALNIIEETHRDSNGNVVTRIRTNVRGEVATTDWVPSVNGNPQRRVSTLFPAPPEGDGRTVTTKGAATVTQIPGQPTTISVGNPPTTTTIDPDGSVDPSNYSPASPAPGVSSDPAVRETGAPTTGVGRLPDGTLFELQSGAGGPAMTDVGLNNPTPDINSHRSHVEGHAAAIMQQNSIQEMTISIDHAGGTCPTCQNGVPSDLGPGQTLNVISPDGDGGVRVQQITRDGGVVELSGDAYDRVIDNADQPATALP